MKGQLITILLLLLFTSCRNTEKARQVDSIKTKIDTVATKESNTEIKPHHADTSNRAGLDEIDMDNIQKARVSKSDSLIWLTANMRLDHRIFGYDRPDTNSKKMILFSIFTNDVEGNPFNCPFGAYYSINDINHTELKFIGNSGSFIKANIIKDEKIAATIYIEKIWIEFDE